MKKIILASKSPRRKELLDIINIDYDIIESNCDESSVSFDNSPEVYVQKLSILKATDVSKKVPYEALIIGADTVVECDGKILGKPKDKEDAYNMISLLSGRTHNVFTGICVMNSKTKEFTSTFEKTEVIFKEIEHNEIVKYISTDEPYDKAGSYAIQGLASCFIKGIIGDYNNVVGLPVYKLASLLKEDFNFDILD
jgi:septum formation protein